MLVIHCCQSEPLVRKQGVDLSLHGHTEQGSGVSKYECHQQQEACYGGTKRGGARSAGGGPEKADWAAMCETIAHCRHV